MERASRAAEVTADMTRARAEATYATSQLHTAHMAAWREKIAALEQARRVCMEDAKLAAELGDPDFDPRALKVQALRLGAQLRFLSANPPRTNGTVFVFDRAVVHFPLLVAAEFHKHKHTHHGANPHDTPHVEVASSASSAWHTRRT